MRVLLIDNLDSFTYMLKDYIEQCGATCDVVRNNQDLLSIELLPYVAVVISPGPETPVKAGNLLNFLKNKMQAIPVLGVCLGHQAIGELFGAKLVHAKIPRHGKVDKVVHVEDPLFKGVDKEFDATRYHSLILENIKAPLQIIASSINNEVMAIKHQSLPIWGIQFHPESCKTEFGISIIKNFLVLAENNR
jgi:anthranilate synthase/aminodeoxychorismate synthase-like glutamine amidotransferase